MLWTYVLKNQAGGKLCWARQAVTGRCVDATGFLTTGRQVDSVGCVCIHDQISITSAEFWLETGEQVGTFFGPRHDYLYSADFISVAVANDDLEHGFRPIG